MIRLLDNECPEAELDTSESRIRVPMPNLVANSRLGDS
jgi:hypothetical protein